MSAFIQPEGHRLDKLALNVLKLYDDVVAKLCEYFINLSTLNGLILCHVNYNLIKLFANIGDCGGVLNVQKYIGTLHVLFFHSRPLLIPGSLKVKWLGYKNSTRCFCIYTDYVYYIKYLEQANSIKMFLK